MAEFSIEVRNDRIKGVMDEVKKRTIDALELCGLQAERNAKIAIENDPRRVDTGLLRNSITYAIGGQSPAIDSYRGDNESRSGLRKGIPTGNYSGKMPEEKIPAVYIGTNVEYAEYVYYGTERMRPNPFLKRAIQGHEQEYLDIIKAVMEA